MKKEQLAYSRGYRATNEGKVIGLSDNELASFICNNGRYRFTFRSNGKHYYCYVHRLQAFQKFGNKMYDEGLEVRHLNGNGLDNSWDNISIGTHSENMLDIPEHIRIAKAVYASSFKIKYNVKEVRDFYHECKSYKVTMDKFSITSKGTLHNILNRKLHERQP